MDLSVKYLTVLSCWLKKYLLLVALKPHFTLVCGHFIDNAIDRLLLLLRCTHLLLAGLARSKAKPSQATEETHTHLRLNDPINTFIHVCHRRKDPLYLRVLLCTDGQRTGWHGNDAIG